MNTMDGLAEFDVENLRELAGFEVHNPEATPTLNATVGLSEDRKLIQRNHKRRMIDARQTESLVETLGSLPSPRETYHIVICGKSSLWDLVPAVLSLAAPAVITRLYVATLGFGNRQTEELSAMLDEGKVKVCRFVCSHYFRATSRELYEPMERALTERGQKFLALRTHAKVLLMELADGRHFVAEGSANLRSCKNIEQFTLTHDRAVFDFHAGWIDQVIGEATR